MAEPAARIVGLKEFRRDLREIDRSANRAVNRALREAMKPTAEKAAALAPVGTRPKPPRVPHLRDTIRPFATARGAGIRSRLPYAAPIHWGWPSHHIKPSLFITKAVKSEEGTITARVDRALDELATRHGFH